MLKETKLDDNEIDSNAVFNMFKSYAHFKEQLLECAGIELFGDNFIHSVKKIM